MNKLLAKAILLKRINRFVAEVILDNEKLKVYVPNTGRLSELALPGASLLLAPLNSKYRFKILYIMQGSFPVMIDSAYSNSLFHEILTHGKVAGLEYLKLIKREPVYGNHRFDFLLSDKNNACYIELKSCTLFHKDTASFPDAVSTRASGHVKALAETGNGRLIFLILHSNMKRFIPNYHTDFVFYETLKNFMNKVEILAYTVHYDENLKIKELKPVPVIIPEVSPRGIFLLVLHRSSDSGIPEEQGYYVCCCSGNENLFKTISVIKRKNGLRSILPDELYSDMKIISDIPVITDIITLKEINEKLTAAGGSDFTGIYKISGNVDNTLVYFKNNPLEQSWFWDMVLELRFGIYSE